MISDKNPSWAYSNEEVPTWFKITSEKTTGMRHYIFIIKSLYTTGSTWQLHKKIYLFPFLCLLISKKVSERFIKFFFATHTNAYVITVLYFSTSSILVVGIMYDVIYNESNSVILKSSHLRLGKKARSCA